MSAFDRTTKYHLVSYRTAQMRPIGTYVTRVVVCVVGRRADCAKPAEPIVSRFGGQTLGLKESCTRWRYTLVAPNGEYN